MKKRKSVPARGYLEDQISYIRRKNKRAECESESEEETTSLPEPGN